MAWGYNADTSFRLHLGGKLLQWPNPGPVSGCFFSIFLFFYSIFLALAADQVYALLYLFFGCFLWIVCKLMAFGFFKFMYFYFNL